MPLVGASCVFKTKRCLVACINSQLQLSPGCPPWGPKVHCLTLARVGASTQLWSWNCTAWNCLAGMLVTLLYPLLRWCHLHLQHWAGFIVWAQGYCCLWFSDFSLVFPWDANVRSWMPTRWQSEWQVICYAWNCPVSGRSLSIQLFCLRRRDYSNRFSCPSSGWFLTEWPLGLFTYSQISLILLVNAF